MKRGIFIFLLAILLLGITVTAYAAEDTQAKRKKAIAACHTLGWFHKIEVENKTPYLYVTPVYVAMPFKDKQGLAALVFAYYNDMNPPYDKVVIRNTVGKRIGVFSKEVGGLKLDE